MTTTKMQRIIRCIFMFASAVIFYLLILIPTTNPRFPELSLISESADGRTSQ